LLSTHPKILKSQELEGLAMKEKTKWLRKYKKWIAEYPESRGLSNNRTGRSDFCWMIAKNGWEHLYSKCCVCGWKEGSVDLAHKFPAKKGGGYTLNNIVPLCPNCHRLFDIFKLSKKDALKIEKFSKAMRSRAKQLEIDRKKETQALQSLRAAAG